MATKVMLAESVIRTYSARAVPAAITQFRYWFFDANGTVIHGPTVVAKAESYVGRRYGYLKILAHWADWLLQGAYVFRRLTKEDRYPICSWLVAHSFAAAGKHFGVEPGAATPDDIWDFVVAHPDVYREILPLARLVSGPEA